MMYLYQFQNTSVADYHVIQYFMYPKSSFYFLHFSFLLLPKKWVIPMNNCVNIEDGLSLPIIEIWVLS